MDKKIILLTIIVFSGVLFGNFCFAQNIKNSAIACVSSVSGGVNISGCSVNFGGSLVLKNETVRSAQIVRSKWEVKDLNEINTKYTTSQVCCQTGDKDAACTSFCDKSIDASCAACHQTNIFTGSPRHLMVKLTTTDIDGKNETSEKEIIVNSTPPVAVLSCPSPCSVYFDAKRNKLTSLLNLKNNSYDPDGKNEFEDFPYKQKSEWYLKGPYDKNFVYHNSTGSNGSYLLQDIDVNAIGIWQAQLVVTDRWGTKSSANCDGCRVSINAIPDASADFECSLNKEVWKPCEGFRTKVGATVYLKDLSVPSQGASLISRKWSVMYVDGTMVNNMDYSLDAGGKSLPFFKVEKLGRIQIKLEVIDRTGRQSEKIQTPLSTPALAPQWETTIKSSDVY